MLVAFSACPNHSWKSLCRVCVIVCVIKRVVAIVWQHATYILAHPTVPPIRTLECRAHLLKRENLPIEWTIQPPNQPICIYFNTQPTKTRNDSKTSLIYLWNACDRIWILIHCIIIVHSSCVLIIIIHKVQYHGFNHVHRCTHRKPPRQVNPLYIFKK